MARISAKFQNRSSALKRLDRLVPEARPAVRQALAQGADEITDLQKRWAPVETGALRDSIQSSFGLPPAYASLRGNAGAPDPDLTVTISAGNSGVRYAHLVEFGTAPHVQPTFLNGGTHPGAKAQPFFYPAFRALRKRVKSRVTRALNRAVKAVAK